MTRYPDQTRRRRAGHSDDLLQLERFSGGSHCSKDETKVPKRRQATHPGLAVHVGGCAPRWGRAKRLHTARGYLAYGRYEDTHEP
eukprot:3762331-Prymnesium_polylepis.3